MARLTEDGAARLLRRAVRRRADGSRGARARRAWRRLLRACAAGDAAAQEAVRTTELTDPEVLELLAAGPADSTDRAAWLTLLGQRAQRQALDPDGTLLGLAYWAATLETRGRLSAVLAAEGDGEAVRAVVGAEQRDRVAAMSYDELDLLGRRLAEHGRYDELRRLALDLPMAKAVAAARLLPSGELGEDSASTCLAALAACSPQGLRAVLERLPRRTVLSHRRGSAQVSFSPDQAELAISTTQLPPETVIPRVLTETVRLVTGESTLRHRQQGRTPVHVHSILHLGDEILRMESPLAYPGNAMSRLHPRDESIPVQGPETLSELRRASTGAVAVTVSGLGFVDRHAVRRRHVAVPRITEVIDAYAEGEQRMECHLATLPEHGLLAVTVADHVLVLDESGTVLHDEHQAGYMSAFLAPDRLAIIPDVPHPQEQRYEILTLAGSGRARREKGSPRSWAALDELRGIALDDEFAHWIVGPTYEALRDEAAPESLRNGDRRMLLAISPYGDMFVTSRLEGPLPLSRYEGDRRARCWGTLELHSPCLPTAREALEQPLLRATPRQWHHVRELRTKVGDPAVRRALALLEHTLADRFGADIALGDGPAVAAGPHDLALDPDRTE
ncbi:hypothetical protein [Streptomyces sp. NBC_01373]|uniref:hypothetical protein n=1 Tax=Streptomyces sp. NBC_01373 TaxID=2903843 RepID=UPI0022563343|nr:hypothetical protein [Streptomyces sp. NBC_01373]MCX4706510.1 hypothetical protein [Streptomyces sp. NBC_01373]